jgi:hypothetical protein
VFQVLPKETTHVANRPRIGLANAESARMLSILADRHHTSEVHLVAEDQQRLLLWLDANVPFYGAYREADRQVQREGKRVSPPKLQ